MSKTRPRRSQAEITRAIMRLRDDELKSFAEFAGTVVEVGGVEVKLSVLALERWARQGRATEGGREYLDAILTNDVWYSSEAAVGRFLRALHQRQAG